MSLQRSKELNNLNVLKAFLMLFVVLGHSLCFWGGNWFTQNPTEIVIPLITFSDWLNAFHIPCFVLVSGYIFYYLKFEKCRYNRFFPFVINKAKRLLIPFVSVSIFWAVPFACLFFSYNLIEVFVRFGLGSAPGQLWFLLMIFWVFVLFYPLSNFFQRKTLLGAGVVIIFYGIGILGPSFLPNLLQIFRALTYIPLFWLGFQLRRFGSDFIRKIPSLAWITAHLLLFIVSKIIANKGGLFFTLFGMGINFLMHVVGALMAFVVLQALADRVDFEKNRFFNLLIQNSMPIYLLSQQIIYLLIFFLNGKINPYLHGIINFVLSTAISLLLSLILKKFKWTKFLLGEKV